MSDKPLGQLRRLAIRARDKMLHEQKRDPNCVWAEFEALIWEALEAAGDPPYPWCIGNPTVEDCIKDGYCRRDPNCGE